MNSSEINAPKISIGMPVYNGEKYIREALDSLLAQTFTDFELIISDNASTDNTEKICREYMSIDNRISYFRQKKNLGALVNFKFVLEHAKSNLFMWAAYDDLWAPNFLLDANHLLEDRNVDFVFPTFELRSIRYGIAKKFPPELFKFIESPDRKWRVLHFMALHYSSLSVNIVYSLFRTSFLKDGWEIQDISNEGAMGAVLLSLGRGVTSNSLFSKRYISFYPGLIPLKLIVMKGWLTKKNVTNEVQAAIKSAKQYLLKLFPEYQQEINFIFDNYHPHVQNRHYRVCSIDKML